MGTPWIALSVPHRDHPTADSGYTIAEYVDIVHALAENDEGTVYETTTARDLLDQHCYDPDDEDQSEWAWIMGLRDQYGLDTTLFRADYIAPDTYTATPIDEVDACIAYMQHDVSFYALVRSPEEARELLDMLERRQPRIGKCGPISAASALRKAMARMGWTCDPSPE